jgi:regulator of RNase E activity RraB
MAPHTMENLKELGMPDESELKLDYFFYSNMLEKVSNLAEDLQKLDYDVSFGEDKAEPGLFIASGISTKISMNEFNVTNWVRRMCELGYIHDCDFDGWGTEPQQN